MSQLPNTSNEELIKAFQTFFPRTKDLVNYLMDVLDMELEPVYQRIRSQIPFSFEEVCKIAIDLDLSIDKLIGLKDGTIAYFDLELYRATDLEGLFKEIFISNAEMLYMLRMANSPLIYSVLNRLPFCYTLQEETMCKYYFYKACYRAQKEKATISFKDFKVPEEILEQCRRHMNEYDMISGKIIIIMDENLLLYMIREMEHFYKIGLLSDTDMDELQQTLTRVADQMEYTIRSGTNRGGAEIRTYLSTIDIEPSYMYTEYDNKTWVQFWSPSSEMVRTSNPVFTARKKAWIESLLECTTLITHCNEKLQSSFFARQREHIANMFNKENKIIAESTIM